MEGSAMNGFGQGQGPLFGGSLETQSGIGVSDSGVPLHMEYLESGSMTMGPMMTQVQPISYLPPWHLTNGNIRYEYGAVSVNNYGNAGLQFLSHGTRPIFPQMGRGTGNPTGPPFLQYFPGSFPRPPPAAFPLHGVPVSRFGEADLSSNWRSQSSSSPGFLGAAAGQKKSQGQGTRSRPPPPVRDLTGPELQDLYEQQLLKFPNLPLEAHKKIQRMPGNVIKDYFEVILVRFVLDNITDSQNCHAIFTTKAETGQCWLMAFSKKGRTGRSMRFNRLLTPHLRVSIPGSTAVELSPSKGSPRGGEVFVFNFSSESEAGRFLDILNTLKSKLWNTEELRSLSDAASGSASGSEEAGTGTGECSRGAGGDAETLLTAQGSSPDTTQLEQGKRRKRACTAPGTLREVRAAASDSLLRHLRMEGPSRAKNLEIGKEMSAEMTPAPVPLINFAQSNATLFVENKSGDYLLLGVGTLNILRLEGVHDELVFLGPRCEVICRHFIYNWNQATVVSEDGGKWICTWSAAADLLTAPRHYPTTHNLKLIVEDQEAAMKFHTAFLESAQVAKMLLPGSLPLHHAAKKEEEDEKAEMESC